MRLPSYLVLGGAKSNARQHWEMASNDYNLTYNWRSSTYDRSKLTITKNGKNCWTLRKPSGEDYSISYQNFSLSFNGWKGGDTFFILMHFTDDNVGNKRYDAFKLAFGTNWSNNTMICDTAGNSHGNKRLVNYNDERHELTWMIQLSQFSGIIAFYYNIWGVDQITIAALSENDYSRLLQVPYGYDHLKPISVGDKLGLVYWDGTECTNSSCSIGISGLDEANFLIGSYNPDKFGYGLQLFKHESGNDHVYKKLRADDGTVNLSGYGITATHLESTGSGEKLKDHLFHVI